MYAIFSFHLFFSGNAISSHVGRGYKDNVQDDRWDGCAAQGGRWKKHCHIWNMCLYAPGVLAYGAQSQYHILLEQNTAKGFNWLFRYRINSLWKRRLTESGVAPDKRPRGIPLQRGDADSGCKSFANSSQIHSWGRAHNYLRAIPRLVEENRPLIFAGWGFHNHGGHSDSLIRVRLTNWFILFSLNAEDPDSVRMMQAIEGQRS